MKDLGKAIGVGLLVTAVIVGCWFGYWFIAKKIQSNRYDVNTHSQQYQAGLISQERDRVTAYDRAVDEAQRQAIADAFCAEYDQLDPPTADLLRAHARICS